MDFMNRGQQSNNGNRPNTVFSAGAPQEPKQTENHDAKTKAADSGRSSMTPPLNKWLRWGGGVWVVIIALLIGSALALFLTYRPAKEANLVDGSKLQAVFLTNDQVYFGKISSINSKFMVLNDIYYLQTSTNGNANRSTANNISLVKLGCELHKPLDQMIINQDQVSFWENLDDEGQVANAVKSYKQANPNGQTCNTASQNTNPVQGSSDDQDAQNSTTPTNTNNSSTQPNNQSNNTAGETNNRQEQ